MPAKEKNVVVYTTANCPHYKMAKEYLTQKGIAYVEHNVAEDVDAARDMVEKSGGLSVPVILIDDKVVVGFNQTRLDRLLK